MPKIFFGVANVCLWVIHLLWPFIILFFLNVCFPSWSDGLKLLLLIMVFISTVVICRGCPFSYIHQYLAVRAGWRQELNYKFEDSMLFRYFIGPFKKRLKILKQRIV